MNQAAWACIGLAVLAVITVSAYAEVTNGSGKQGQMAVRMDEQRAAPLAAVPGDEGSDGASGDHFPAGATVQVEYAVADGAALSYKRWLDGATYARWVADSYLAQWIADVEYAAAIAAVRSSRGSAGSHSGSSGGASGYCSVSFLSAWFGPNAAAAASVCQCESGGNPNAQNPSGAHGLFQLMPQYHGYHWSPEDNAAYAAMLSNGGRNWSAWVCKP